MKPITSVHEIKIAKSTLRMSDIGAEIMGGMDKDRAREVLLLAGYTQKQIERIENA